MAEPVLYRPDEHDRLIDDPWDADRARDGISAVVAEAEEACDGTTWPAHPQDEPEAGEPPWTTMYLGSAGTCYGLYRLGSELDVGAVLERALARYREQPDFPEYADPRSLLGGEAGFREEWHESAELLWAAWDPDTNLFTNDLYGERFQFLGPGHGLAGAVHALRGFRDRELRLRVEAVFEREALRQGELANWPPVAGIPDPERIRVQWCQGAPGVVATVGDLLPLELAVAGGNVAWAAGPLKKGPGLCHGTAGNGYAFLRLHALTGDESWLGRARRFAMHALAQVEATRAEIGRGRFGLWTGDVGVALYVQSCLDGDARFPTLDRW